MAAQSVYVGSGALGGEHYVITDGKVTGHTRLSGQDHTVADM